MSVEVEEQSRVVVQEGTAWGLEFTLTDKDGNPDVPTLIAFKIHDEASGSVVGSGSIAAASAFAVTFSTSINTLVDRSKTSEDRILTLTNTYTGIEDKQIIEYRWTVKRSRFFTP